MSFVFSPSEILSVIKVTSSLCKLFENAGPVLDGLRKEIKSLHKVFSELDGVLRDHGFCNRPCSSNNYAALGDCTGQSEALADQIGKISANLSSLEAKLDQFSVVSEILSDARKHHPCIVPNCIAKPFTCLHDLQYHIKTMHKSGREHVGYIWPKLLQRIEVALDRCKTALSREQCKICVPTLFMERRLKIIAATNFLAAVSVSISFLWLSQTTGFEKPSGPVRWIISASISVIPEQIIRSCRLAERSFIIALYLLFSAIYSTSTIAWFATRLQKISLYRWYIYTLAIIIFWALLGVTHAELFLFFLPLSISIGICLYSICSRLFVIPPSDKRCGEDQD